MVIGHDTSLSHVRFHRKPFGEPCPCSFGLVPTELSTDKLLRYMPYIWLVRCVTVALLIRSPQGQSTIIGRSLLTLKRFLLVDKDGVHDGSFTHLFERKDSISESSVFFPEAKLGFT